MYALFTLKLIFIPHEYAVKSHMTELRAIARKLSLETWKLLTHLVAHTDCNCGSFKWKQLQHRMTHVYQMRMKKGDILATWHWSIQRCEANFLPVSLPQCGFSLSVLTASTNECRHLHISIFAMFALCSFPLGIRVHLLRDNTLVPLQVIQFISECHAWVQHARKKRH